MDHFLITVPWTDVLVLGFVGVCLLVYGLLALWNKITGGK